MLMEVSVVNRQFNCAGKVFTLDIPRIMGVLNVTPDSFYDGGWYNTRNKAVDRAAQMVSEGATIIDIGGESTRPGSHDVITEQEEMDRVVPVIECISKSIDTIVSVDTSSPLVMVEAVKAGAGMINDVRALQRSGAVEAASEMDVPVILMHSLIERPTKSPEYVDVLSEVLFYLEERIHHCLAAGIKKNQIIVDPGFGGGMFGKTPRHNLKMVQKFELMSNAIDYPILIGISRKGFLGAVTDREIGYHLPAALAVQALLLEKGAAIVRTHDVAETLDVIKIVNAMANN